MKKMLCPFEKEVLANLKAGDLQPHLKEHIDNCSVCAETRLVYGWMNQFQQVSVELEMQRRKIPPVDVDAVWDGTFSSSSLLPDRELVKKALRPMIFPQILTYLAAAVVLIFLIISNFPVIDHLFGTDSQIGMIIRFTYRELAAAIKSFSFIFIPVGVALMSLMVFMVVSDYSPRRRNS
jgi:hypothetical protein